MDDEIILPYKGPLEGLILKSSRLLEVVSSVDITLYPLNKSYIETGITVYFPGEYTGVVTNNNLQASNGIIMPHGSIILNGVCEVKIMLFNLGTSTYRIKAGITRIANLVLVKGLSIDKEIKLLNRII
ncbi:MAG: hypothetical protein A3F67_08030 [Verrucomicrobia bacterium RIFCSPHIGHO2_12_FULL_41_10]|nr:MAG: hypothetical protein A3F67_08030 [Verrucomicrobia bacterium RIFCSPHIGHO2_12_FULL_41_10]